MLNWIDLPGCLGLSSAPCVVKRGTNLCLRFALCLIRQNTNSWPFMVCEAFGGLCSRTSCGWCEVWKGITTHWSGELAEIKTVKQH